MINPLCNTSSHKLLFKSLELCLTCKRFGEKSHINLSLRNSLLLFNLGSVFYFMIFGSSTRKVIIETIMMIKMTSIFTSKSFANVFPSNVHEIHKTHVNAMMIWTEWKMCEHDNKGNTCWIVVDGFLWTKNRKSLYGELKKVAH